ncbi:YaeQ family protein [Verticiella sediminum]|uniref:YaeQ family protein n=1 Tax=Verticiella sediminum TaxID=1247510 RepID=A0A556AZK8_9BURK|nr:YaeQ family protein [Verticiella sediminum]TSH98354.1 YaeQ family protein [Verticiella sediminum]
MALPSTVFKAQLQVADMDRHYYAEHALTVARHPSETDERMMVRVLAYALHADEALAFGPGLSSEGEPDLVLRDLTGAISLWIDVGLPDEKALRKACGRAERVVLYVYGRGADVWWQNQRKGVLKLDNLTVVQLPAEATRALGEMAARSMQLQCNVQDGAIWFGDGERNVDIHREVLHAPASTRA